VKLGLDAERPYLLWEFWNEQYLGSHAGAVNVIVPPMSARVFRLTPQRDHPWILSTDMHVRQGEFEVLPCEWDAGRLTLCGQATRPKGEKDAHGQTLIVRKELRFEDGEEGFELSFASL